MFPSYLTTKKQCPKGFTEKPNLPLQAKKIESLLLKERWQLIQKDQDRKLIRIKGKSIFLEGKLFATVISDESRNANHIQYSGSYPTITMIRAPLMVLTTTD